MGVCIIYPIDPMSGIPGGIETFIDGLIRWAPREIDLRVIGITTDLERRPVGRWTECRAGERAFAFFPVLTYVDTGRRPTVPISLRFMLSLARLRPAIDAAILEFHRIEPVLLFLRDARPKMCFIHTNLAALRDRHTDIRWKHAPSLYFAFEDFLIPRLTKLFCVREDAVESYRRKHPRHRERFEFTPTWVDPLHFYPAPPETRARLRFQLAQRLGRRADDELLLFVGRLDYSKDPLLLIRAFAIVRRRHPSARLVMIGDGVLRADVERLVEREHLSHVVTIAGIRPKSEVADWLRAADAFVLSSAYEGMPMAVLEALGCGLPVAATDVGEVRRVVRPAVNGEIARERTPTALAEAIERCLDQRDVYAGHPCTNAVLAYSPKDVVGRIYDVYRRYLPDFSADFSGVLPRPMLGRTGEPAAASKSFSGGAPE